jgi:hypothetical protein
VDKDEEIYDLHVKQHIEYSMSTKAIARRPMTVEAYSLFKPFHNYFIVIKPSLGWTFYGLRGNFPLLGLAASLNLRRFLSFTLSTRREEDFWKEEAAFQFDMRVFELDLSIASMGESFRKSFTSKGLSAHITLCFGY